MKANTVKNTVSYICNNCAFHPFECERESWCNQKLRPICRLTEDEACPLMAFEADEDTDKRPRLEKIKDGSIKKAPSEDDMWLVCCFCQFASVDEGTISIEDSYMEHCIDCPLQSARESLQETKAEAMEA